MARLEDKFEALHKERTKEFFQASPSRLLEMALEDVQAIRDNPKYVIRMQRWHDARYDKGRCAVCAAGAVLANRLHYPIDQTYMPLANWQYLDEECKELSRRLIAIDALRQGCVSGALNYLKCGDEIYKGIAEVHDRVHKHPLDRIIPFYNLQGAVARSQSFARSWDTEITQLIADMRAAGL